MLRPKCWSGKKKTFSRWANDHLSAPSAAAVPTLADLQKALTGESKRVDYRGATAAKNYAEFRTKLEQLIDSGILDDYKVRILREGIEPFDRAMGWNGAVSGLTSTARAMSA